MTCARGALGTKPVAWPALAGPGPVSAIRRELDGYDCTLLAQRSASGRIVFAAYPTEQEAAGAADRVGPGLPVGAEASFAEDEEGRVVAATVSPPPGREELPPGARISTGAWRWRRPGQQPVPRPRRLLPVPIPGGSAPSLPADSPVCGPAVAGLAVPRAP